MVMALFQHQTRLPLAWDKICEGGILAAIWKLGKQAAQLIFLSAEGHYLIQPYIMLCKLPTRAVEVPCTQTGCAAPGSNIANVHPPGALN